MFRPRTREARGGGLDSDLPSSAAFTNTWPTRGMGPHDALASCVARPENVSGAFGRAALWGQDDVRRPTGGVVSARFCWLQRCERQGDSNSHGLSATGVRGHGATQEPGPSVSPCVVWCRPMPVGGFRCEQDVSRPVMHARQ